jgi:hypothetical protein
MNGLHRERVAQHEREAFGVADVREPVPRKHALGRDDEIIAVQGDRREKRFRCRRHVSVHEHLAGGVENADVHGLYVEIDSAIVAMLTVVKSHRLSSYAVARIIPAPSLPTIGRCRGRPE